MGPPLHEALAHLRAKPFSDIPTDDLEPYLRTTLTTAHTIANSVPPAAHYSPVAAPTPNSPSPSPAPPPHHTAGSSTDDIRGLWTAWGKPVKLSARDNPLALAVYKMAGADRHGAWFARRSLHRGLGFGAWRAAMAREFDASLAAGGGPGHGAVRGIAADRRIHECAVEGVARLQVFQLSAAFPGPVTPRDFVTMTVSSQGESALEEEGRSFVVVSIPVEHPDAPLRDGLVRGFYESVEMIREVKLPRSKDSNLKSRSAADLLDSEPKHSESRQRGITISYTESRGVDAKDDHIDASVEDDEYAVEWIMITRSDPGGGIPRFMVERNTPASITQDAVKFLKWAVQQEAEAFEEEEMEKEGVPEEERERRRSIAKETSNDEDIYRPVEANGHLAGILPTASGIISSITGAAGTAVETYAPDIVRERLEPWLPHHRSTGNENDDINDDSTETSSLSSFASAKQFNTAEEIHSPLIDSLASTPLVGSDSSLTLKEIGSPSNNPEDDKHYKELAKLEKRRRELEQKFERQRERDAKRTEEMSSKEMKETERQREKLDRDIRKQQERHDREMRKLEERRDREAKKQVERQRKLADKDELARARRERDDLKMQVDVLRVENELLRKQIGGLQRENTALVREMGKVDVGGSALRLVREELNKSSRDRASSTASKASRKSKESKESKASKETTNGRSSKESGESGHTEVPVSE